MLGSQEAQLNYPLRIFSVTFHDLHLIRSALGSESPEQQVCPSAWLIWWYCSVIWSLPQPHRASMALWTIGLTDRSERIGHAI